MRFLVLTLAFVMLTGPALAQPPAMSAAEKAATDHALARGQLLYQYDQAAWHGTDALLARLPESRHPEVKGWVVEIQGARQLVTFYGVRGADRYAVASVVMDGQTAVEYREVKAGDANALSPLEQRLAQARDVAMGAKVEHCGEARFNTVVLPPADAASPAEVYLLTPQVTKDVIPAGGHYLIAVAADGTIASQRSFTRSCLNIPGAGKAKRGETPAGFVVTHLLDPTPAEIHVFLSATIGVPVFVVTGPDKFWMVQAGKIERMKP